MNGGDRGETVRIVRLVDLETAGTNSVTLLAGVARIFRDSAARWPDDPSAARAFQELWLDQYVRHERELVWLATRADATETVVGYLVGCRIDPALSPRFAALEYFKTFAALTAAYPAHLHINVDRDHRNQRVGERLTEAFCAQMHHAGISGVHVVTGSEQRNVKFYKRLGFRELATAPRGDATLLLLGRASAL